MLIYVAEHGLENAPHGWVHEASKHDAIYEFRRGKLRLFFFKGKSGQIAVCTSGTRKNGRKADKGSVQKAAKWRKQYFIAHTNGTLAIENEDETE